MAHSDPYRRIRGRLVELAASLDDAQADLVVPATPEWTVHDVYAHLSGEAADILAGNLEGVTTDPWTAAQVEARRHLGLDEIVAEWTELGERMDRLIDDLDGAMDPRLFIDAWAHEQDVRAALGRPGGAEPELIEAMTPGVVKMCCVSVRRGGLAPIAIRAGGHANQSGDDPVVRLDVEPRELLRGTLGRRSLAQMRAWHWTADDDVDLDAYIERLLTFGISPVDLHDAV